jgi:amino acid adenylation domain-containing protein/non-ribosomal peptide synthase protein (TIGR01720 family)
MATSTVNNLTKGYAPDAANITTLLDLLREQSTSRPTQTAYTFIADHFIEEQNIVFYSLDKKARSIGSALQQAGLAGERAILLFPPGLDYIAAFFGCIYAGATAIPAFPPRPNRNNDRLISIIRDCSPAAALTSARILERSKKALAGSQGTRSITWIATDSIDIDQADAWQAPDLDPEGLAYLQYTSGSTADPKGVMVTHQNVISNLAYINHGFGHTSESVSLTWLPHFHDMGLVDGILEPLYKGFRGVLMSPGSFLQRPSFWLEAITHYGVTHTGGPNFAYDLCVRRVTQEQRSHLDLNTWRVAYNGSEPVRKEVMDQFTAFFEPAGFRPAAFYPAYGLAEATLKVSGGHSDEPFIACRVDRRALEDNQVRVTSSDSASSTVLVGSGKADCGTDVRIVNPNSHAECPPSQIGEIWVRGPGVAAGYWKRPAESKQVFGAYTEGTQGPFLRTGDLGFIAQGELFVTGRLKDLIILRGRNIYPQDIEQTAGLSHEGLRSGGAAAFSIDIGGEERLAVVQEIEHRSMPLSQEAPLREMIESIRRALSEVHEVQAHAIVLVSPGAIPKTSSGKTRRRACRELFLEGSVESLAEWVMPAKQLAEELSEEHGEHTELDSDGPSNQSAIAGWLMKRIAAKSGVHPSLIDSASPLSAYGLDSLASVGIVHDIESTFGVRLTMSALLSDETVDWLSSEIFDKREFRREPQPTSDDQESATSYSLSPGQEAIWFICCAAPENGAYNIAAAARIVGGVNVGKLQEAFQTLVDRHPALRTTFTSQEGIPIQQVSAISQAGFTVVDATDRTEEQLNLLLGEDAREPFDFANGPLMRVRLYRRPSDEFVFLIAIHHLVADFWSLAILMDELGKLYPAQTGDATDDASGELPLIRDSYKQYVKRQQEMLQSAAADDLFEYWRSRLEGAPEALKLPIDKPRPLVQSYSGGSVWIALKPETAKGLVSLGAAHRATIFTLLLTSYGILLSRWCNQEDILIGTPTAGRDSVDFAGVVGYFVNSVVLRSRIDESIDFGHLLENTRETVIGAFAHQEYPFSTLIKKLNVARDSSRSPLFQTMFALQKSHLDKDGALAELSLGDPQATMRVGGLTLRGKRLNQGISQFELSLTIAEGSGRIQGCFEYNSDLFDLTTIERLSGHFARLLDNIIENPRARLSELPHMSAAERHQLMLEFNDTEGPKTEFKPVHGRIEMVALNAPDSVALVSSTGAVSYAELNCRSNKLASYLLAKGVGSGATVAIMLSRSFEMVTSLIGVLKAGAAYIPLDPGTPNGRIAAIASQAHPTVALTETSLIDNFDPEQLDLLTLDGRWGEIDREDDRNLDVEISPHSLAYVVYTSGTTGTPKGVMISHGALSEFLTGAPRAYGITASARSFQFASLSFDASAEEIYGALVSGAALFLRAGVSISEPSALIRECTEQQITILPMATAYWHETVSSLDAITELAASAVRNVIIGGESALPDKVQQWIAGPANHIKLINSYGPTETAIGASTWSPDSDWSVVKATLGVPIGRPIDNYRLDVLDGDGRPSAIGITGELCISGLGLGRGYWGDPGATAERFVPDDLGIAAGLRLYRTGDLVRRLPDGNIQFIGRKDQQVKVRGFRIELGEIESVLSKNPAISEAVVVVREDFPGEKRIVAYVVPEPGAAITEAQLRGDLKQALPSYMIPAYFVFLDAVPVNHAGKIDRRHLPLPKVSDGRNSEAWDRPMTPAEKTLERIWSGVLRLEAIEVNHNFFELGGDSILSLQMIARARDAGIELTPRDVFQTPTIAELASAAGSRYQTPDVQGAVTGEVALNPIQHWFFEQQFDDPHHWNMSMQFSLREKLSLKVIESAIERLIEHHPALRSTFRFGPGAPLQCVSGSCEEVPVREVVLSGLSPAEEDAAVQTATLEAQGSLNPTNGPIARFVLFNRGPDRLDDLLMVVHHLVVDAFSLRILAEDLDSLCFNLSQDRAEDLPRKQGSVNDWSTQLLKFSASEKARSEAEFWLGLPLADVPRVPVDFVGANLERTTTSIVTDLSCDETASLLQHPHSAYRATTEDLLIAALGMACCEWLGSTYVLVEMEAHGRESIVGDSDLAGAVGWFTSAFPVLLRIEGNAGPGEIIKSVKQQLREIPNRGISYGALRYLEDELVSGEAATAVREVREALRSLPTPEISFNYLGQTDQTFDHLKVLSSPTVITSSSRSANAHRSHLLEIDAMIAGGRLRVDWRFSSDIFGVQTIKRLADSFTSLLHDLMAHCLSVEFGGFTPSDFPLAGLGQTDIDLLIGNDRDVEDVYPLSPAQQGMLFHSIYDDDPGVYVGWLTLSIKGNLHAAAFEQSWRQVIQRHAILRTSFKWERVAVPLQVVHRLVSVAIATMDWDGNEGEELSRKLDDLIKADQLVSTELSKAPLLRLTLIRVSQDESWFVLSSHHLILDGWSLPMLLAEVFATYRASKGQGPFLAGHGGPFRKYIAWLKEQDRGAAEKFWRNELSGFAKPTSLAIDRQAPRGGPARFGRQQTRLSSLATEAMTAFGRRNHLTVSSIVSAAWGAVLSRYSGDQDVLFGLATSGRPASLKGGQDIIGPFINTLPMRVRVTPEVSPVDWIRSVQERQVEIVQYEYCSLLDIQGWSDVPRGTPLFNSLMAFENYPVDIQAFTKDGDLEIRVVSSMETTNYPLSIVALPGDEMAIEAFFDPDRIDAVAIDRLLGHLRTFLSGLTRDGVRLSHVPLLTETELRQVLHEWSGEESDYPKDKTMAALFEDVVACFGDSIAVVFEPDQLSYSELNRRANQVGCCLAEAGVGPEVLVGISTERSAEMVVGLVGIVKTGGAYLPLDLSYPVERLQYMARDAGLGLLLVTGKESTERGLGASSPTPAGNEGGPAGSQPSGSSVGWDPIEVLRVKEICQSNQQQHRTPIPFSGRGIGWRGCAENLAYVMYTSGSTGLPKGVCIPQQAVNRLVRNANYFDFDADQIFLQFAPLSFDASTFEIWGALLNGARVIVPPSGHHASEEIGAALAEYSVTVLFLTIGLFHLMMQDRPDDLAGVRMVITGGDVVSPSDIQTLLNRAGAGSVISAYGPTESTTFTSGYLMNRSTVLGDSVPIGRPISNTRVYVLDPHLNPVPVEISGDLFIAGDGLERCYLNSPALTADRLIPEPFSGQRGGRLYRTGDLAKFLPDGNIDFVARRDNQIKIRGFRVELEEVQIALSGYPTLKDCAVIARGTGSADKRLVAFVVNSTGTAVAPSQLRDYLKKTLPEYMTPAEYVFLDALPLTENGKVDRRKLRAKDVEPASADSPYVAPRTPAEEVVAGVWAEVLGRERIGVDDDFFELGGHSLVATRIISTIRYLFKVDIPVSAIFKASTVAGLTSYLMDLETKPGRIEKTARLVQQIKMMSPEEKAEILRKQREAKTGI